MSVDTFSIRAISLVAAALILDVVVSALSVPNHQIAARKMVYPQREWSEWQDYPVRTVEDISFAPKAVPLDRFGGRLDRRSVKTGFFYTRKIAGRWWLIDPDGHPFLNAAIVSGSMAEFVGKREDNR